MSQLSLIIPIRNRVHLVEQLVSQLRQQSTSTFETVFVDDGSSDDTLKAIEAATAELDCQLIKIPHSGPSAARNAGASKARNPYLLFVDSDDSFPCNFVELFDTAIREDSPDLVHAGLTTRYRDGKSPKIELPSKTPLSEPVLRPFLSGTYAIRADIFWKVGGFTESLRFAEHRELAIKLAESQLLQPDKIVSIQLPLYNYEYRSASVQTYHKHQAAASEHILQEYPSALQRAGLHQIYHRIAVTGFAQAGAIKRSLSAATRLIRAYPYSPQTYSTLLKIPYHIFRSGPLGEKLHTIGWFLQRPSLYPELLRLFSRKFYPQPKPQLSLEENRAYCASHAVSSEEAVERLMGSPYQGEDYRVIYKDELYEAADRQAACPGKMGGGANAELLFMLCESLQATRVLETGVAYGWSSLAILLSLKNRPGSILNSTDLPYPKRGTVDFVGCVVPEHLRAMWTLFRLPDREGIPKAVKGKGGIFHLTHYDSDKSYSGRKWGYRKLWDALSPGGVFLSDDIGGNPAFLEFARDLRLAPIIIQFEGKYVGALRKPHGDAAEIGRE